MSNTATHLRSLRAKFIDLAAHRLTRGEGLRMSVADEIARFYDLLQAAVETGSPEWVDPCLEEWVKSGSGGIMGERPTLLPVLNILKAAMWDVLRESLTPETALGAVFVVEPMFDHAWLHLSGLEIEALLIQAATKFNEAQKNLQQLDKSKTDFISVAAHELKTPLTLIEGYATMLSEQLLPTERERSSSLVSGIAKGIARLREIVEDIITVSMIDNNMLALAFQPVRLRQLVQQVSDELSGASHERQQILAINDFDDSGATTYADPQQLRQMLRKLVGNAIKYTPDGGRITISARGRPGFVEVMIADTGIGIAPEQQQIIFEKFAQAGDVALHSTGKLKFKGGGAGLGLAIARGIIEAHGGAIWAESPGYDEAAHPGSTFHVMIPIRESPPPDDRLAQFAEKINNEQ